MKNPFASLLSDKQSKKTEPHQDDSIKTSVLDLLSDGMVIFDGQSGSNAIFYANPAFLKYYGLLSNQVIGRNIIEFYSHYLNDDHIAELHSAVHEATSHTSELCIHHEAQKGWLRVNLEPMKKQGGGNHYLILTQADINQMRQVRQELKASNQKLQQLVSNQNQRINEQELQMGVMFEQAVDNMLLLDDELKVLDVNDSARTLFEHSKADLLGLKLTSLLYEFTESTIEEKLSSVEMYQEVALDEVIKVSRTNDVLSMLGYVKYITMKAKNYIVLTLRDISKERIAQNELRRSQSELEEVVRSLNLATQAGGIGIWSWDFKTNELSWDERMYQIYGVDPNNCDNNYAMWQERVLDEDIFTAEESLNKARENLTQFNAEFRIQLPDQGIRWIKAAADVLFDQDGTTPIGMGGVNIDVTKEKTAQANLRHESEIALAASEAKSMFLANMSHEIRTPMNGVVGMLSLLSESELNGEQRSMVTTIKDSALTLLHIINDILDFSKIEAGQMSLESVPVELQKLIERTLDVLCLQANNKGIELYLTYDASLPKVIMSDSVRLSQVLLNLVGNAVKFTDSTDEMKGKIWVSATLNQHDIAPYVEIMIEDNGIGMTEEQIDKLFKAFSQADTSTTRLYGGTGLGLSITRSLLEMMGGDIQVDSRFGVGSRFSIELPFIEVEEAPQDPTPNYVNGSRILFVTNDQNIATFCDINLANFRCKTNCVANMQRAIAVLDYANKAGATIDLIIVGPDLYHYYEEKPLSLLESALLEEQKFIFLSRDPSVKPGLAKPNYYVMPCNPLKPSELTTAIGVMRELISDEKNIKSIVNESEQHIRQNKNGLILVVDDQPTNRDVIQRQLHHLGYQCELAVHGQEALHKWKHGRFDLILTDCHMPVMDGYELASQIRSIERQSPNMGHTPIVAITANAMVEASEQCFASGMDDYLTKPVELKTLDQSIEKWMQLSPIPIEEKAVTEAILEPNDVEVPSANPRQEPICMSTLEQILGTREWSIVAPLLAGYWESVNEDIGNIEHALVKQSHAELQQIAHAAKGAARSAGANKLADKFEILQNTAHRQNWRELSSTLQMAKTELSCIESYLIEHSIIEDTEVIYE
ncbi:ATP-binding protein [Vibrio neptunius]|uniref:histidine kinase n=1 Tax=Vibrio neptunius TaxID=170651 RepID=A0ABS3A2S4_9VIBR|nr:ATP-binding protein [Vibrio neptunius]MBN3494005.1 response regulator [Vibrio neptunius]MBN3516502.1 response regulator [Vibrio neptunius]MBN3550676.1 response regulator [Vibrio neptunius]MBN3578807.1 response regulator [Vibrio neptunius]MCH9872472.1 response regulator [Vibrio neptunius]